MRRKRRKRTRTRTWRSQDKKGRRGKEACMYAHVYSGQARDMRQAYDSKTELAGFQRQLRSQDSTGPDRDTRCPAMQCIS